MASAPHLPSQGRALSARPGLSETCILMDTVLTPPLTVDDLLAMPDDGIERDLINGRLRERPMTLRNHTHSGIEISVGHVLRNWLDDRPAPRGKIVGGEAGFILRRDPDTFVGIDVAYISAEQLAATPPSASYPEGPPILAVEILSPSDTKKDIDEKIKLYLDCGVLLVWLIDPYLRTVLVIRPDARPELFTDTQEITAEPHLPGFRAEVRRFFDA